MFPDVRLLIAAVFASVVALSCGFGVFAALRVNHAPLGRMPPVIAPLQLATSGSAPTAATIAAPAASASAPLPLDEMPSGANAINLATREIGRSNSVEPASQRQSEFEPEAATDATPQPVSVPAAPAAASAEENQAPNHPAHETARQTPSPGEGQHARVDAANSAPVPTPDAPAIVAAHDTGESSPADKPSDQPIAASSEVTGSTGATKPNQPEDKTSGPAQVAAPDVAAIAPATEPAVQPGDNIAREAKADTAFVAPAITKDDSAASVQKPKPMHKAVRNPPRRVAAHAPYPRRRASPYAQYGEQSYGSTTFQSAPDSYQAH